MSKLAATPSSSKASTHCGESNEKTRQYSQQRIATTSESHADSTRGQGFGGLPRPVANVMENHFGTSFADVKIHADESAARDTFERGAAAYTKGSHVYFGSGQFRPATASGQRLIAHELAHVVQQRNGRTRGTSGEAATATTQRLEDEADNAAESLMRGRTRNTAVVERASHGNEQFSLLQDMVELRAALSGGMRTAARWVLAHTTDDPVITDLGRLMSEISALPALRLPREVIASMEERYAWARSRAPSWLPVPSITFHGDGSQGVAVVDDVAILAILLFIAFLIVMWWLMRRANPVTRRADDEAIEEMIRKIREGTRGRPRQDPKPDEDPDPNDKKKPEDRPPPPPPPPLPQRCPYPTGLSVGDPIPIQWHKIPSLYDSPITIDGHQYRRDDPTNLPRGEPIGVPERFWPSVGKIVQLAPERRGTAAADFRGVLQSYGYDWGGPRFLNAEHVQDVQWARPDGENLDTFRNLWPYDGAGNMSAGATQNMWQRVSFCETVNGPPNINVTVQSMKRPGGYGRFFIIRRIGMPE